MMHSNLLVQQILSIFSRQMLYDYGNCIIRGSMAMAKLFSTICQITLDSRLPENYKQGFVFISISQSLPFESIKKSYPNIQKLKIFLSDLRRSSADFMLMNTSCFMRAMVSEQLISLDLRKISRSVKESLLYGSYLPQSLWFFWTASLVRWAYIFAGSQLNSLQQVRKQPSLYQQTFRLPHMEVTRAQQRISNLRFLQSNGSMYSWTNALLQQLANYLTAFKILSLPCCTVIPVPLLVSSPGLIIQKCCLLPTSYGNYASLPSIWYVFGMISCSLTFSTLHHFFIFLNKHFLSEISQ